MDFVKTKIDETDYLIPQDIAETFSDGGEMLMATWQKYGYVVEVGYEFHKDWWNYENEPLMKGVIVDSDGYRDTDLMITQHNGVWHASHLFAGEKGTTLVYLPLSNVYKYWNNELSSEAIVAAKEIIL